MPTMTPRICLTRTSRQLCMRPAPRTLVPLLARGLRRGYAEEKKLPGEGSTPATGPNQDVLGHVSEEAAEMERIGNGNKDAPDLAQGTPVQEILKRDQEGKDAAPDVIKEEMDKNTDKAVATSPISAGRPPGLAAAALARAGQADEDALLEEVSKNLANARAAALANPVSTQAPTSRAKVSRRPTVEHTRQKLLATQKVLKWGDNFFKDFMDDNRDLRFGDLETKAFPKTAKLRKRYEPIVEQVTKLLMRHGMLARAQRNMATILNYLRCSSPPTQHPQRCWVPGTPPASHLPLNPVVYLTTAIDSVAPLVRIKNIRGAAGGGASLPLPHALQMRQRRRQAVMWILDVISKRPSKGSGKHMFATKFAEEIVAIAEGRSAVWDRRLSLHRQGAAARANKVRPKFKP